MKFRAGLPIVSPRVAAALALLSFATGCSDRSPTAPASPQEKDPTSSTASVSAPRRPPTRLIGPRGSLFPLPAGVWGGDRAELDATPAGATVRFFCAHGALTQPVVLEGEGRFSIPGWLVREGGPTPVDETRFRRPAVYSGRVDGQTMTLDVLVDSTPPPLGTFTLVHGQKSTLGPCPIL